MKKKLTLSYALQQVFLWAQYGCLFSYANNYLTAQLDLSKSLAGIILGLATGISFLLQPILATVIEKTGLNARMLCLLGAFANGISCLLAALVPGGAVVFVAVASVTLQILPSFSNAMGMEAMRNGWEINFAFARGVGSVAFGVSAKVIGSLTTAYGYQIVVLAGFAIAALFFIMTLSLPKTDKEESGTPIEKLQGNLFRREPRLALLILASILLYVGHNALCNCMLYVAKSKLPTELIHKAESLQGSALLIAAVAELPAMFFFTKLLKKVRCDIWLCLSCCFMTLKLLLTWVLPGEMGLLLAQTAQLGGYALYAVASVYYVGTVVRKEDVVKGQTYLGASNTLGCLIAYVVGGVLCDAMGTDAMLATCLSLSIIGTILLFFARQRVDQTVGV